MVNVYKQVVLHLDSSFKIRDRLKVPTVSEIASLNDNAAVVTSGYGLEFLEVRPKLRSVKSVSLGESTQGVAVGGDLIYVSCFQGDEDNGNIRVLNKEGEEIRRIDAIQNGLVLFKKTVPFSSKQDEGVYKWRYSYLFETGRYSSLSI